MLKKKLYGLGGVVALVMAGGFVCSPVFADGPVDIKIVEKVEDGSGGYKDWEDITGAMPGMNYSAIPRVLNQGSMAVGVKMCLTESATSASGETMNLPVKTFGIEINENWNLESGNLNDPAAGSCYNYNRELGVGEETEPLFKMVTLSPELRDEYMNATFNLHLDAYAAGDELPEDDEVTPGSPDTGETTNSEPLTTTGYVVLSLGAAVLLSMISYLVVRSLRKK